MTEKRGSLTSQLEELYEEVEQHLTAKVELDVEIGTCRQEIHELQHQLFMLAECACKTEPTPCRSCCEGVVSTWNQEVA